MKMSTGGEASERKQQHHHNGNQITNKSYDEQNEAVRGVAWEGKMKTPSRFVEFVCSNLRLPIAI